MQSFIILTFLVSKLAGRGSDDSPYSLVLGPQRYKGHLSPFRVNARDSAVQCRWTVFCVVSLRVGWIHLVGDWAIRGIEAGDCISVPWAALGYVISLGLWDVHQVFWGGVSVLVAGWGVFGVVGGEWRRGV